MLWTTVEIFWAGDTNPLGVPFYDVPGVGYHIQKDENLKDAPKHIHTGLASSPSTPTNVTGIITGSPPLTE